MTCNINLVRNGQVLAVLCDVFSDEDVVVVEQDVQQLIDAVQTLLPHIRLKKGEKGHNVRAGIHYTDFAHILALICSLDGVKASLCRFWANFTEKSCSA